MTVLPMNVAPRDGTRIIALCIVRHYHPRRGWHDDGTTIQEIWWHQFPFDTAPRWHEWCGNPRSQSTNHPLPVCWMHVPKGMIA